MEVKAEAKRKKRLWIGPTILVLGIVATGVLWFLLQGNRTNQIMALWVTIPATAFFFTLWWTFFSGLEWSVRGIGLGVLAAAAGLFFGVFRLDGFSGDFVPQFAARWVATAEERAEEYWETVAVNTTIPAVKGEAAAGAALVVGEDDWPEFRGVERDGIVRGVEIRRDWENHPPELLWKHPVGKGWSSFAVVDRFAFTLELQGKRDVLVCYDVESGGQVWKSAIPEKSFSSFQGGPGPMSTPTVFDSRVYSLGGKGELTCHKAADGELLWETNILEDAGAGNLEWGMSASPLVYDDFVVVNPGGTGGNSVVAYDRLSGKKIWSAGSQPAGYSSPSLATLGGVRQVLVFHGTGISGHDPQTGQEFWNSANIVKWENSAMVNAAQPIVRDEKYVFISSGYSLGCSLLEVTQSDGNWAVSQMWKSPNLGMKFSSGVYRDGYVYGLDEQILVCVDYMTGKRMWRKRGNFGYGQLILVEDLLLIITEKTGEVVLHEAKPQSARELGRFPAIKGITWNHPVLHRGKLLVRNGEEAACFDLRPASAVARAKADRSSDAVSVDSGGEAVKTAQSQD